MAIPDYQAFLLPLLEFLADRREHHMSEVTGQLSARAGLTSDEREQMLPSGQQTVVANRIGWAKTYLKKTGLLHNPVRGSVQITGEGIKLLAMKPAAISRRDLEKFPSFKAFIDQPRSEVSEPRDLGMIQEVADAKKTPEEAIEAAHQDLRNALADDLLERVRACSPTFFEQLVVQLLVAMGYGGSLADAGHAVGRTGDGGIDGIINEDRLGLDVVCIQAKRWQNTVGRPEVQAFAGSMAGMRATKGVLITTSAFSREAREYVDKIGSRIVLIDGKRLAQLMIDFNIGVTTTRSYSIKRPDSDYFVEDGAD